MGLLEFGIWFLWLFGGPPKRREIDVSLRTQLCLFLGLLYSWGVELNGDKIMNFMVA